MKWTDYKIGDKPPSGNVKVRFAHGGTSEPRLSDHVRWNSERLFAIEAYAPMDDGDCKCGFCNSTVTPGDSFPNDWVKVIYKVGNCEVNIAGNIQWPMVKSWKFHQSSESEPALMSSTERFVAPEFTANEESYKYKEMSAMTTPRKPTQLGVPIDTECSIAMLREAADTIENRAASRDVEKEKTMLDTINAFNAMYHTNITEEQGWMFMVLLKMRRARGGGYTRDDYVDGAAYFALAAEGAQDDQRE